MSTLNMKWLIADPNANGKLLKVGESGGIEYTDFVTDDFLNTSTNQIKNGNLTIVGVLKANKRHVDGTTFNIQPQQTKTMTFQLTSSGVIDASIRIVATGGEVTRISSFDVIGNTSTTNTLKYVSDKDTLIYSDGITDTDIHVDTPVWSDYRTFTIDIVNNTQNIVTTMLSIDVVSESQCTIII